MLKVRITLSQLDGLGGKFKLKIPINYGNRLITIEIPNKNLIGIVRPKKVEVKNEFSILNEAINNPLNFINLSDFLSNVKDLTIVINDHERPTPTAKILESIYNYIKDKNFRLLVASGTHRPPKEDELKVILGKFYDAFRSNVVIHNCRDRKSLTYIGKTSYDTEVYINNLISISDKIIVTGSILPHYFAGFTGGRKFLVPGVSGYETIEHNHMYALSENAQPLKLKGNPVHEDMMSALNLLNRFNDIYSIMTVITEDKRIYYAASGHINNSFFFLTKVSEEIYSTKISEKADIVIAIVGSPFDISLYQSQKAIEHAKLALRRNGILILVSECRDGIGPRHFYDLMASCKSPDEIIERVKENYKLGYHKAARLASLLKWAEIWMVSSIKPEVLSKVFIKSYSDLQNAIYDAIKLKGNDATILVIYDASLTIPKVNDG